MNKLNNIKGREVEKESLCGVICGRILNKRRRRKMKN
jgi:predicted nucleic acid-binding Zn ribbon protein